MPPTTATNPETGERFILTGNQWKPFSEDDFQRWYGFVSRETGINPDPDDARHHYDYRTAFASGDADPLNPDFGGHWPSKYKAPTHPNRYVDGIDTISGKPARTATNPDTKERFYFHEGTREWLPMQPEPEKTPVLKAAGHGLAHGTLTLAEDVGLAMQYAGGRMSALPKEAKEITEVRPEQVMSTLAPSDQARVANLMADNPSMEMAEAIKSVRDYDSQQHGARKYGQALSTVGKQTAEYWDEKAQGFAPPAEIADKNVIDSPEMLKSPVWWAYNTMDMVPSLAGAMVPAMGTYRSINIAGKVLKVAPEAITGIARIGAALAGGAAGGGMEGAQTYKSIIEQGGTEEEAARAGELMALFSAGLNAISTGNLLTKAGPGFMASVKRIGLDAAVEGLTEGAEEPAEVMAKIGARIMTGQPVPDNVGELFVESLKSAATVAPVAALSGGGMAAITSRGGGEQDLLNRNDGKWVDEMNTAFDDVYGGGDQGGGASGTEGLFESHTEQERKAMEREITAQNDPIQQRRFENQEEINKVSRQQAEAEQAENQQALTEARRRHGLDQRQYGSVDILQQGKELLQRRGIRIQPVEEAAPSLPALPPGQGFELQGEPYTPGNLPALPIQMPQSPQGGVQNAESIRENERQVQQGENRQLEPAAPAPNNEPGYQGQALQQLPEQGGPDLQLTESRQPGDQQEIDAAANGAATSPLNDTPEPTDAQKKAGNYRKGHIQVQGIDISVENPEKSIRQQKRPENAGDDWVPGWQTETVGHYGYFTHANDTGDGKVDVYVGHNPESKNAYIIDQRDVETGKFDEPKVVMAVNTIRGARKLYLDNYETGWTGIGAITKVSIDELKQWLDEGNPKAPFGDFKEGKPSTQVEKTSTQVETPENYVEKPEVPEFKSGKDAVAFGESATQDQIDALDRAHKKSRAEIKAIMDISPKKRSSDQWLFLHTETERASRLREALQGSRGEHPSQRDKRTPAEMIESGKKRGVPKGPVTLRGRIKQAGGINFLNFKGEAKNMPVEVKFLSRKAGVPIDLLESTLRDEGWIGQDEDLLDILTQGKTILKRGKVVSSGGEAKTDFQREQEQKFRESAEYEPEEPPPGEYVEMNAEDLPEGSELTIIDGSGRDGWDQYKITGKDPFGVTLEDGVTVELRPLDRVQVRKSDLPSKSKNAPEPGGEVREQRPLFNEEPALFDEQNVVQKPKRSKRTPKKAKAHIQHQLFGYNQYETFSPENTDKLDFKEPEIPPDAVRVRMETTGYLKSSKNAVRHEGDAAALLSHLVNDPQENVYFIATDNAGQVIEVHKASRGIKNRSLIHSLEGIGNYLDNPDVSKIYFAHNHPSGNVKPSQDDFSVDSMLRDILDVTDAELRSLVIGEGSYVPFMGDGTVGEELPIPSGPTRIKVPQKERRTGSPKGALKKRAIQFPPDAVQVFKQYGDREGILYTDGANQNVGFMPWPKGMTFKKATQKILAKASRVNAYGMIINLKGSDWLETRNDRRTFVETIQGATSSSGAIKILDVVVDGKSMLEEGRDLRRSANFKTLSSDRTVFSSKIGKGSGISPRQVSDVFAKKGFDAKTFGNLTRVKTPSGYLYIDVADAIVSNDETAIKIGYGRKATAGEKVAGSYENFDGYAEIKLKRSLADNYTLEHELYHHIKAAGVLNLRERRAIERSAGPKEEDQARWIESKLRDRGSIKGVARRAVQKIADILDAFINIFRTTQRGILRKAESGSLLKRTPIPTKGKETKFSKTAGRWFSQMEKHLANKLPGSGSVKQIKQMLASWAKKGKIKAEELEWSGLNDWLDSQDGKVPKQQVLDYLAENNVRVEEVEKGTLSDLKFKSPFTKEESDRWQLLRNEFSDWDESEGGYVGARALTEEEQAEKKDFEDRHQKALDEWEERKSTNTKFSDYQLPGGENYKELLLTLPAKTGVAESFDEYIKRMLPGGSVENLSESQIDTYRRHWESGKNQPMVPSSAYTSSHWEEPNVLAHVRFNERTDSQGRKVLFIEEVQSDWHQEGRRKGYGKSEIPKGIRGWTEPMSGERVPDAPFKKTWPILAMKRMVRYAAENGYDAVAWTPGDVQADRYDLSKQVDRILYWPETKVLVAEKGREKVIEKEGVEQEQLENYIGKEAAQKLFSNKRIEIKEERDRIKAQIRAIENEATERQSDPDFDNYGASQKANALRQQLHDFEPDKYSSWPAYILSGDDLKVGGEGMKGFYDKILPAAVNKFFNKAAWGKAKVGKSEFGNTLGDIGYQLIDSAGDIIDQTRVYDTKDDAENAAHSYAEQTEEGMPKIVPTVKTVAWSLPVTDKMRSKALHEGMPLFSTKEDLPDFITEKFGRSTKTWRESTKEALEMVSSKEGRDELTDTMITQGVDRLHPVKQVGDQAYRMHRIVTGSKASFSMLMEHGKLEWDPSGFMTMNERKKGFLPFIKGLGKDWNKFFYWVAARRAEVLESEGREKWLDARTREKIYQWAGGRRNPKWVKAADRLHEFNASVLDLAEKAGLIDPGGRQVWEQDFYVPFYRIFEDDAQREEFIKAPRKSKRYISAQIKRLHGAERKLGDPLENLLHNWTHLISESMRNVARSEAYEFSKAAGDGLIDDATASDIFSFRVGKKNKKTVYVSKNDKAPVLVFQSGGAPVYFKVNDPELFYALSEINTTHFNNWALKLAGKAKRALTYGATFGPAFRVANALRDTVHTAMLDKSFLPFYDTTVGFFKALRENEDYIKFMASGAGFGSSYVDVDSPQSTAKFIRRIVKHEGKGALNRILDTPKKMLDMWEKIGAASENAARVQLYSKIIKKGDTHTEAAFRGRDLLDFTMRGESRTVQFLIQTVPFLNARMQGLYKLGKAAVDPANKTNFAIRGALLTAASLALWWAYKDDDRYKELEDWERWSYYHFWIGDKHYRIPKPFEVGAIFSSSAESIANVMNGNDQTKHIIDFIGFTAHDTFAISAPQLVSPLIEQWANKSFFTGRPIVGPHLENLVPGQQADPWTSESLQLLGKKLGVSPKRAEHLIRGYFATLGTLVLGGSDILVNTLTDFPANPSLRIDDMPMVGRFVRQDGPQRHTKQLTWFYETFREMDRLSKTLAAYRSTGRIEDAMEMVSSSEAVKKISMGRSFNRIKSKLSDINKEIRLIWYSKKLDNDQKRKQIDELIEMRNDVVRQLYDNYFNTLKK